MYGYYSLLLSSILIIWAMEDGEFLELFTVCRLYLVTVQSRTMRLGKVQHGELAEDGRMLGVNVREQDVFLRCTIEICKMRRPA